MAVFGESISPTQTFYEVQATNVKATSVYVGGTLLAGSASQINRATDPASRYATDTAVQTLALADLNKVHYLNSATEFATTLPTVASSAGYWVSFIVKAAPSGASYTILTSASENKFLGHILTSQDAGGSADSETSGGDTITITDGKAVVGDRIDLECDGAFWYIRASSKVFDAIVITTAS